MNLVLSKNVMLGNIVSDNNFKGLFGGIYKNRRVLVTGHTGFKGSWLSLYLNVLHAKVYGISDSIPTNPSHYQKIKKIFSGDYRINLSNTKKCNSLINKIKPDYIFHLAAQSLVGESYDNPIKTFQVNGLLRGVIVPKGIHTVQFVYDKSSFNFGLTVSILSLLVSIGLIGLGLYRQKIE